MVKIIIDGSHGVTIPGKQTSEDESESNCDDKVVRAVIGKLKTYKDVEVLRIDDPAGKVKGSSKMRTDLENEWKADIYVSIHHNAFSENEIFHNYGDVYKRGFSASTGQSIDTTATGHPRIIKATEKRNSDIKRENFHVLRGTVNPHIIVEGVFMNSLVDIIKLCDDDYLQAEGEAIAEGLAKYIKLQPKIESINNKMTININEGTEKMYSPTAEELVEATTIVLQHLESDSKGVIPSKWLKKIQDGTLTESDSVCLLYVAIHRWLSIETDS